MKRRAMTLAELTITIALAFALGYCVFLVILPSFRIVNESQIRTELQQQGELALQQITADLQNSVPTGISILLPSGTQGAILSANPLSSSNFSSGQLSFNPQLLIWWHNLDKSQLFRRQFQIGDPGGSGLTFSPSVSLAPPSAILINIVNTDGPRTRSYAKSVDSFLVQRETTTGGEVYALRMVLTKVIPSKKVPAVVELFRKVMLRNHY